jgi:hypothetical protein
MGVIERLEKGDTSPAPYVAPNITSQSAGQCGHPVRPSNEGFQPSPLITINIIKSCVNAFFASRYPILPILDREQVYATLTSLHDSPEQYGLITAVCAVVTLQPEVIEPVSDGDFFDTAKAPSSGVFIEETLRARKYCDYIEQPSLASVQTSFFLFAALFATEKDNSAWFYLREAMTLLQIQRLHEETTYAGFTDDMYATNCRRTFWLLFITERAYALQRNRPLTLKRTVKLPIMSPEAEDAILHGFLDLVSLFQNFDEAFLSMWNASSADSTTSQQHLIHLQNILRFALSDTCGRTETQQADLLVSRQWLKIMVWRLCVIKGLLSSAATDEILSFQYPVIISRDVIVASRLLPPKAFEANGIGILEKVFDIGCSLADMLLYSNSTHISSLEIRPRDYLMELLRILGTLLGGNSKYLGLLAVKADECLRVRIRTGLAGRERSSEACRVEGLRNNGNADKEEHEYNRNKGPSCDLPALNRADMLEEDPGITDQSNLFDSCLQACQFSDSIPSFWAERGDEDYQIPEWYCWA